MPTIDKLNLSRPVLIFLSKDGAFAYARKGTAAHAKMVAADRRGKGSPVTYLPAASVRTLEEAEEVKIALCKNERAPGSDIFRFSPFDGTLEGPAGLEAAGRRIEELYQHRAAGKTGWPESWGR